MTINVLPLSRQEVNDSLDAYRAFLEGLKVPNPRQLVLVNPPMVPEEYFDLTTAKRGSYFGYPPVGLLYIAAVAKEVNPELDVRIVDLNYDVLRLSQSDDFRFRVWEELLYDAIQACDAPQVGVTYMLGTTKRNYVEISTFIRGNFPHIPLLAGGVQASYDYKEMLESDFCDIVFRNEGEEQFRAFLESSIAQEPVHIPWGSAFKCGNQVYELGEPPKDVPVDRDIRPYYSLIDIEKYHNYGALGFSKYNGEGKSFATVLSNRGCRAKCTFCTVRDFNGIGVRLRPVKSVVEEVKFLVRDKGIKQIDWLDDDLLFNSKRAIELFKGLAEEVPELEWTSTNGLIAAAISEEVMYWMVKSGVTAFKIGIESGNDRMLRLIKKPTSKPKLREKRELFRRYPEVFASANFIIGFPNETFGEIMETFDFAKELEWDWCTFNICQPLKGTEVWAAFQELGDDRCFEENYSKTLNPGRSSLKGEIGYHFKQGGADVASGRDVFDIPDDVVPNNDQLREIWFTFNLLANFLNNPAHLPGGNPAKLVKWLEAIHAGYPYDASMCASLAKTYKQLGNQERYDFYQKKFQSILAASAYWQRRVRQFPELLDLSEISPPAVSIPDVGARVRSNEGVIMPNLNR